MYKKIITCLALGSFITSASAGELPNTQVQPQADVHYMPDTAKIYFDIDGVILKKTVSTWQLLNMHKLLILKSLINLPLVYKVVRLWRNKATSHNFKKFFEQEQPELVTMIDEITLTKAPIAETVAIISQLRERGYQLGIASNMAKEDYEYYEQKYNDEIFSAFDSVKVVDSQQKPVIKKPSPQYFQELLEHHEQTNPGKLAVFVDDEQRNVDAAQKAGFGKSIRFTSGQQLHEAFEAMGIFPQAQAQPS